MSWEIWERSWNDISFQIPRDCGGDLTLDYRDSLFVNRPGLCWWTHTKVCCVRVSQTARCSFLVNSREIYFAKTLHVTTKSWCVLQILWNSMAIQHTSFCSCFKIQKYIMTHLDYALLLIDILINQYIIWSKINYCSPNININSILNSSYFAVLDMEN